VRNLGGSDIVSADATGQEASTQVQRHSSALAHPAGLSLAGRIDHAEPVPLWIREDDVVRVWRSFAPVNLGRAQSDQAFHLMRLIVGVQVEVKARRDLQGRANLVEREVRADAFRWAEQNEVVALSVVSANVAERCLPELGLTPQIVDAQNDRADTQHRCPILSGDYDIIRRQPSGARWSAQEAFPHTRVGRRHIARPNAPRRGESWGMLALVLRRSLMTHSGSKSA
jgi:hypothetical protein